MPGYTPISYSLRLSQSGIYRRQHPQKWIRRGSYSRRPFPSLPYPLPFSLFPCPLPLLLPAMQARPRSTKRNINWANLHLEPHDYQIYYVNVDLRHQYRLMNCYSSSTNSSLKLLKYLNLVMHCISPPYKKENKPNMHCNFLKTSRV